MRILHLLASPVFSGPAENVTLLALEQRKLGHEVHVAIDLKRPGLEDEEPLRPRLEQLGLLANTGLELSVKSSPLGWFRDIRALRQSNVDVIHSHFSHDHFIAKFGRPKGAVLVRSVHAPRSLHNLPKADAYTTCSEKDVVRGRARVLPALLAPDYKPAEERAAVRAELGVRGDPVVGMVSHFQPSRRHDVGLKAFAELKRAATKPRLLLVGDGPLRPELEAQAKLLGIDRDVTFAGYQSGAAFVRHLKACDVVWILGLGNDFTARSARQARACGARVVGVDEGALPRWADEIVPLIPEAVAAATVDIKQVSVAEPTNEAIARDILALYDEARAEQARP